MIENAIFHPDYQRQGSGKAMMHHAIHIGRSTGLYKVFLQTGAGRPENVAF
ncbi:MAG: GNAT family N-acetyltransferase [Gammaproteobacteria bacterium]|nr:GNAT family N-acetyltransferase [Gammaproteobacteria bacterium]